MDRLVGLDLLLHDDLVHLMQIVQVQEHVHDTHTLHQIVTSNITMHDHGMHLIQIGMITHTEMQEDIVETEMMQLDVYQMIQTKILTGTEGERFVDVQISSQIMMALQHMEAVQLAQHKQYQQQK
jgi:hypothetical protein